MADEPEDPEVIRQQMEVQRASLAEKLETLENKIVETVHGAREAVAETVQSVRESVQSSVDTVKDSVQSSVETVRETLDIKRQVDHHPWAMFGGSVALGFAAGWLLNRLTNEHGPARSWGYGPASYPGAGSSAASSFAGRSRESSRPATSFTGAPTSSASSPPAAEARPHQESWVDQLSQNFAPEIQKVKGLAIGAVAGVVRDLVAQSIPEQMRPQLNEMMDNITTKLGGEPVQPEFLDQILPRRHDEHHNGHQRTAQEELHS